MSKILYRDESLLIIEKSGIAAYENGKALYELSDLEYFQHKVIRGMLPKMEEVWAYNPQNRSFECVKKRDSTTTLLKPFLASKDVHIRCDVVELNTAKPTRFRFEDDKDHFIFQLKF